MQERSIESRHPSRAWLHNPDTRVDPGRLVEIARDIARDPSLWRHLVRHDLHHRSFERLYRSAEIEVWLLTWTNSQAIELHDHGGSSGAVAVVEGELYESFTDVGRGAPLRHVRWPTGRVQYFGPHHVHDLQHRGGPPATSLHVYSPPLASMTFYHPQSSGALNPLRTQMVEDATAGGR